MYKLITLYLFLTQFVDCATPKFYVGFKVQNVDLLIFVHI